MENSYTENLAEFGNRERGMLRDILKAWEEKGLPRSFEDDAVRPAFNKNSGNVFLVNADYQVAMLAGDTLELFVNLPYGGAEGFINDLLAENNPGDLNSEDSEALLAYAEGEDKELPKQWQLFKANKEEAA